MSISDLLSKYSKSKIEGRATESLPATDPISTTKSPCSSSSSWIKRLDSARYDSDMMVIVVVMLVRGRSTRMLIC